jgi:Pyruvate/2-oxoacid:ferredoxin oxidoreductase delta subunit
MRVVIYEGRGAEPLAPDRRFALLRALLSRGYAATVARGGEEVAPADASDLLVFGDFKDGTPEFQTDGKPINIETHGIGDAAPEALVQIADDYRARARGDGQPGQWKPWFPVIDYDRCTNCMQCLTFCLFDVYGVDQNKVIEVRNEDKCKTNCPACSRVCPEVAILFPKYRSGPINGDAVAEDDLRREKMKIDVSALLGGDIYSMLRDRHARAQSRFSKERDESKALKERMRCLKELQESLDIPEEVLMALPTREMIETKAKQVTENQASGS